MIHLGIVVLVAVPLLLPAQDVSRRYRWGDPSSRPYYMWGMRGMMEAAGLRINRRDDEPLSVDPTDAQWHEIAEYMKRELPNAWEFYQHQTVAHQVKMRRQIFAKFQATEQLRHTNQLELYALRLQEQKLLDQTAGLIKEWRSVSLDKKAAVRQQIRLKVREQMQVVLKEQQLRIQKLEQQLADAKNHLTDEQHNLDAAADHRSDRLLDDGAVPADDQAAMSEQASAPSTQPAQNPAQ
jgi:hypothetical protein